ncbi:MAG TPA: PfkB family carbohydrate kinase [Edaphocola sp.]|nr:PfkB family carbohydrate kinase [Edaphocola sp.]
MSLLSVGTMAFDSIETPFGKAERIIGGSAMYVAWAASHFYQNINQVSIIGHDFPDSEMQELSVKGVNFDGVESVKDGKSFFWSGKYHEDMNSRDTLITELNVLEQFDPKLPESYKTPKCLMLGNLAPATQISVLDQLNQKPGLVVLDTMNFWMDVALGELKTVLKRIDVLVINDSEARQLSGEKALIKAAVKIQEMGPRSLIIKKGEHGALLFEDDRVFSAPAMPLAEVFDPTGAGDVFAGGFVGYLAATGDYSFENKKTAVIAGSVLASFCVEKFGVQRLKEINQKDIMERMVAFNDLARFNSGIMPELTGLS